MSHGTRARWWRPLAVLTAILLLPQAMVGASAAPHPTSSTTLATGATAPTYQPGTQPLRQDEESEEELLAYDTSITGRRLAGDKPLTLEQAGQLRAIAAHQANILRKQGTPPAPGPTTFDGAWSAIGPNPITTITRSGAGSLSAVSGRIGALAIRPSNDQFILGAAQGGIWLYDADTGTWVPKTDDQPSLAIGALAVAPGDDAVIYAGTGEGALSGDSYYGNGVLKSTDGGETWSHVSGDYFVAVSISRIVVDPTNADHLFATTLSGTGGARRTRPTNHSAWGVWESSDGGATWSLIFKAPKNTSGATDLEMDPQDPGTLYVSFWGDSIYKTTDGGKHWTAKMNGLPTKHNSTNQTRWSMAISHPEGQAAVLYVGSDWIDDSAHGVYHKGSLWRSDDGGDSWQALPTTGFAGPNDSVLDYCGGQCWYDNVVEADPTNPNIVYAGGQFNYNSGSGGIFRSDDGGQTWKDLGWNLHPDYHAFAFGANPNEVLVGSDGGVWYSPDRGGRLPGAADEGEASKADFQNYDLNGGGLQITQFSSIATNPTQPSWIWGGSQDNGTEHTFGGQTWYDLYSGDGGQVLVDPTDYNYVYGTYYGISPYRATDGGCCTFFSNQYITGGLNLNDRSDFYIPWVMNQRNPNQLFLGTYRLYRTDNAKAPAASDVHWTAISGDLTSGCSGTAPNGARNCSISAIGVGGGTAVYTGSLDGQVWLSTNAQTSDSPTWTRLDQGQLPNRPVTSIAVDPSNYRIAYVSYAGFSEATPSRVGHVYKTTDGGQHWTDVSGDLPSAPVNSVLLDPSFPNTLYAGTDVGPFVTYNGGADWYAMGSDFPIVAIWQLNMDPSHRTIAAGTHGRGAFEIQDGTAYPALVVSKVDANVPVGPSSQIDYTLTVSNIGNADASGVTVSDPVPGHTSFVSADNGGSLSHGKVTWTGQTVAAGDSVALHFSVDIASALKHKVSSIVNDGIVVSSDQNVGTTGSPTVTPIAPPYALSVAPASQIDGARLGETVTFPVTITNKGYNDDSFAVATSGSTFPTSVLDASCTSPLSTTASVAPGATATVCVSVDIPADAASNSTSTATVTATSMGDPSQTASATTTAIAVGVDTLVVDEDGNSPDVQSYYTNALDANGVSYDVWDLSANSTLPLNYLTAHTTVVWFTGNAYPDPIGRVRGRAGNVPGWRRSTLHERPGHPGPGGRAGVIRARLPAHHMGWV